MGTVLLRCRSSISHSEILNNYACIRGWIFLSDGFWSYFSTCISRDSMHKRRATGGKKKAWRKKRKYELGRQPANTKLSSNKTVRRIRVRGGNVKWRALRLDTRNYSWGSEAVTRKRHYSSKSCW
ncbi:Ribosomal protein S8e [Sesbania bispinosa]|nr:Ribosomal protein S8e [Sesbania bispinosa]